MKTSNWKKHLLLASGLLLFASCARPVSPHDPDFLHTRGAFLQDHGHGPYNALILQDSDGIVLQLDVDDRVQADVQKKIRVYLDNSTPAFQTTVKEYTSPRDGQKHSLITIRPTVDMATLQQATSIGIQVEALSNAAGNRKGQDTYHSLVLVKASVVLQQKNTQVQLGQVPAQLTTTLVNPTNQKLSRLQVYGRCVEGVNVITFYHPVPELAAGASLDLAMYYRNGETLSNGASCDLWGATPDGLVAIR